jgi:small subunit ribosomal protein S1
MIENPLAQVVEGSNGLLLEIDGQIVPNYDATMQPFEEGEVVTGNVVRIDKDEVLVDIGYKSEGVIPANELSIRKSVDPREEVSLGEEVDAMVLTKEDQDGRLIMSKKRARFEKAWRRIEAAAESGEPVMGSVIEVVKGGLIIDLGVRGFLPASLVDIRRVPNLDEYLGTQIETKVIELNRSRNNVVLSRRAVLEEERKEVRQQILDRLQPGLVVEGQISNIVDFGAFVDLDGIDGLIHISELSWSHVNHPSEILGIGDTVQVKVLDIDRDRQRISLGLKQTQEDPWQRIMDTYNVGDELAGKVTKVVTFGAFVEVLDGVEGLVHISELAGHHVESPREIVHPGDEIRVKILEIDSERRRLSLSAKRVEDQILPLPRQDAAVAEPVEQQAAAEEPAGEEQLAGSEAVEELAGEQPAAEVAEVAVEEPALAEAALEESPAEQPVAEVAVEEPVTDQAVVEQPPAEEPAVEQSAAEESAAEEPTAEPAAEEPAAEEPAAEATTADVPVTEESVAETEQSADEQPAEQAQD